MRTPRTARQQPCKSVLTRSLEPAIFPSDIDAVQHQMRAYWQRPIGTSTLFESLSRFARRIVVHDRASGAVLFAGKFHPNRAPLELLADVIMHIAERIEDAERAASIKAAAHSKALAQASVPPPVAIRRFLEQHVGLESRTAWVLRAIEQSMATPLLMWLKRRTRILSKDVTSADGWSVMVHLPPERGHTHERIDAPGACSPLTTVVTHLRKERGLVDKAHEFFVFTEALRFVIEPDCARALTHVAVQFPTVLYDQSAAAPALRDALEVLAEWNAHVSKRCGAHFRFARRVAHVCCARSVRHMVCRSSA